MGLFLSVYEALKRSQMMGNKPILGLSPTENNHMEGLIKSITAILPILEQYPTWVRLLFSGWLLLSVVVIISFILAHRQTQQAQSVKTSSQVTGEPPKPETIMLQITKPQKGDKVGPSEIVRGVTTLRGRNLYLVVIPLQTGDRYIVDGPLTVDLAGGVTGRARYGEAKKGIGEWFAVSILATKLDLFEGVLDKLPSDSQSSDSIEVERVK